VYQIQTKFRDELRSRGGLLRTREFIMKDAYSLDLDEAGLCLAYDTQTQAYKRIFARLGLCNMHMIRSDTGLMGGRVAHEFTCVSDAGEDTIALCRSCGEALNAELVERNVTHCSCGSTFEFQKGIEVGNIFQLGTRYGDAAGIKVTGSDGKLHSLVMGSYGIGISRLLATLVEQHHDERGIALTAATTSYDGHIVTLASGEDRLSGQVYEQCQAAGISVLWDDRDARAGEQLADADLIGTTIRLTIGNRWKGSGQIELTERRSGAVHLVSMDDVGAAMKKLLTELEERETAAAQMS
jgi:prolyl-tRNA synthetase